MVQVGETRPLATLLTVSEPLRLADLMLINNSTSQMRQWNDPESISSNHKGQARGGDGLHDVDQYIGREVGQWKVQIVDLERWAMELEMQIEEVNRHTAEGTQEIMRGTMGMLKGTTKIRAAVMDSDGLRRGKKGGWRLRRGWKIW